MKKRMIILTLALVLLAATATPALAGYAWSGGGEPCCSDMR